MRITGVHVLANNPCLVRITTDEGYSGIGATSAHAPAVRALVEDGPGSLGDLLLGEDPTDTNRLWRKMFETWQAQRGRGGEGGLAVNAMSAIDLALWDLTGKARGLPIYKLLGGAVQSRIMVYASATAFDLPALRAGRPRHKSPEELVRECRAYMEEGFKAVKFGWGNYFGPADLESLGLIREAIGPETLLMIDFGCPAYLDRGWTVKDAMRVARLLEDFDVFFLEEPLHPYDADGFAALTQSSRTRIATGESLTTSTDFRPFLQRRAVDVIQPDAQQMGITQMVQVARQSEEEGLLCIPHCPWTGIAVAAHLNVLATVGNGILIEYPAFAGFRSLPDDLRRLETAHRRLFERPLEQRGGYLELSTSPGLGLGDLVPEAIQEP